MTTTAIRNISRTILVLNLTQDVAPKRALYPRTVAHRDGSQELKEVRVVHGDSIHLLAGETRGGLSNAVRRCPDIVNALAARKIVLIEEPDAVPEIEVELEQPIPPVVDEPMSELPADALAEDPTSASSSENDTREAPASDTTAAKSSGRNKSK